MAPAIRVGLFTDSDAFAGTERHILDLAAGLSVEGAQVSILCPTPSPLAERALQKRIPVVTVQKGGLIDVAAIRTLRALLLQNQLEVIHSHNGRTALSAAIAVRLAGRGRCVTTQHFLSPNRTSRKGWKGLASRLLHQRVSRWTHHFIAISQAARAGMLDRGDAGESKISVVPNGIVEPVMATLTPPEVIRRELDLGDAPLIVCVARLEPEKDIATLVTAMAEVVKQFPEARCVVAGEGHERDALEGQIRRARLGEVVRLLGFRTDSLSLINAGDVFVLPSRAEPFGLVLLEAMSLSKPVIATRAGGPKEIVAEDETGLLVPPSSPEALAGAINHLLGDLGLRNELGRRAQERFRDHFTAERMSSSALSVYVDCLSQ